MRVIENPHFADHDPRWEFRLGPETYRTNDVPERVLRIRAALDAAGGFVSTRARPFPSANLRRLHPYHDYIEHVCSAIDSPETEIYPDLFPGAGSGLRPRHHPLWMGLVCTDAVTPLKQHTYRAAKGSADAAQTAADLVLRGEERQVYALCRPSGHHAGPRVFGGYCYFNNAALAAELLSSGGQGVLLDIDFHHGNGTQEIFWRREDVYTASIHCDPDIEYPYYTGYANEVGDGPGRGKNLNIPLPRETDEARYLAALHAFAEAITPHAPQWLVVAAGFDTHERDHVGGFRLPTDAFERIGAALGHLALPTVIVQEGGYALDVIGPTVAAFLKGFAEARQDTSP